MIDYFGIDQQLNQRISFKILFENYVGSVNDERNFRKSVDSIYLQGIINQKNSGLRSYVDDNYNYQEILLLQILLNDTKNPKLIENIVHKTFPNPVVLLLKYGGKTRVSVAVKRTNKLDNTQSIICEERQTSFIEIDNNSYLNFFQLLSVENRDIQNLFEYYNYLYFWVKYENVYDYFEKVSKIKVNEEISQLIDEVIAEEQNIEYLKRKKTEGRQVSEKMQAHKELTKSLNRKNISVSKLKERIE